METSKITAFFTWGLFYNIIEITRKHYRTRNYKTTPIVEITLLGLCMTICHIPNTGVHKIDNPINLPVTLVIVTIVTDIKLY